jgi:hypothetical protein
MNISRLEANAAPLSLNVLMKIPWVEEPAALLLLRVLRTFRKSNPLRGFSPSMF